MTMHPESSRVRGYCHQLLMVILINVPTTSLGLAMGWVSLVSGERGEAGEGGAAVVAAAAITFVASLGGVPLSAWALTLGRKFAIIATSACFLVCWSLKLCGGGWWVVGARVAAGVGGAGAFSIAPLVAKEMCSGEVGGAAAAALIPAHNLGFLLMYLAADLAVPHRTVVWACLALSLAHCAAFLLVPESPAFLAASGRTQEAERALRWLRGGAAPGPDGLDALPPPSSPRSTIKMLRDMMSNRGRRRAFYICFVAIVGQEACGVYTLMQFAERTFVLTTHAQESLPQADALVNSTSMARFAPQNATWLDGTSLQNATWLNESSSQNTTWLDGYSSPNTTRLVEYSPLNSTLESRGLTPARQAVILGVVQLVASAMALYLVERVGRRRLLIWSAVVTGVSLALGACVPLRLSGLALGAAVAADSAGLQPAPYALLADMFHYEYRGAALMAASAAGCAANALEVAVFPALVAGAGLRPALALAAALTLAYAAFALLAVPDTAGKTTHQIYQMLDKEQHKKTKQDPKKETVNAHKTVQDDKHVDSKQDTVSTHV